MQGVSQEENQHKMVPVSSDNPHKLVSFLEVSVGRQVGLRGGRP